MQDFNFHNPVKIVFGRDKTSLIGEMALPYGKRVLVLYGQKSAKKTGILGKVTDSLKAAGIEWVECGGVKPNPVLGFANDAIETFKEEKLDSIVAVGGGSVIDTAKTVAAGVCYDGDVWDFFCSKATPVEAVPITVVLTLPAAASEMNSGAVITNEDTLQKFHFVSGTVFPKVSILDPTNTFTVPINYSMYGAIDAVIHLLESYFNNSDPDTPIQDRYVEGLVKTIIEASKTIFSEPDNYDARANMMWSASLALNGLAVSGVGVTGFPMHMIEHSLSAIYDIAHGAGLAIIAPAWMRYVHTKETKKLAQFAERIFDISEGTLNERALKGIHALEGWFASIEAPVRLEDANIPAADIRKISENVEMSAEEWGLTDYSKKVIEEVLTLAAEK